MADGAADLSGLDRLVSRSVAVIGALALVIVWSLSGRQLPRAGIAAFAAAYGLGKAAVAVAGAVRRWPPWPSVLAEGLAMAVVALIVWTGTKEVAYLLPVAVLLVGAALWRSRTARRMSGDA